MFFDYRIVDDAIGKYGKVKLSDLSDDQIEAGKDFLSSIDSSEIIYDGDAKAFGSLYDPIDLAQYLTSKRKISELQEKYVSHYTNFVSAKKIVSGKKIYLCNPAYMNDGLEFSSPKMDCSKLYFASFSLESSENMGMWSMYGQPWEAGIKISIPKKLFLKWKSQINEVFYVDPNTNQISYSNPLGLDMYKSSITRVAYFELDKLGKVQQIRCGENARNTQIKSVDSPVLAGYIKDIAWSYEKEIRLRIDLKTKCDKKNVAVPIPDEIVNNMIITTSPRFDQKINPKDFDGVADIKSSIFTGKLNYIYCDRCKKNVVTK